MLFLPEHIKMIKTGIKTATRRQWKKVRVKIGGVYPAQKQMFQHRSDCDVFFKVKNLYQQTLGRMTDEDYKKEGNYTELQYIQLWKLITGDYNPLEIVWVVEFEKVKGGN